MLGGLYSLKLQDNSSYRRHIHSSVPGQRYPNGPKAVAGSPRSSSSHPMARATAPWHYLYCELNTSAFRAVKPIFLINN